MVFESVSTIEPESHVRLVLNGRVPSPAGPATPGRAQTYTVEAEPAFFVEGFQCRVECSGDGYNPLRLTTPRARGRRLRPRRAPSTSPPRRSR